MSNLPTSLPAWINRISPAVVRLHKKEETDKDRLYMYETAFPYYVEYERSVIRTVEQMNPPNVDESYSRKFHEALAIVMTPAEAKEFVGYYQVSGNKGLMKMPFCGFTMAPLVELANKYVAPIATKIDPMTCEHKWGTDGAHSNEYCKKCFVDKEVFTYNPLQMAVKPIKETKESKFTWGIGCGGETFTVEDINKTYPQEFNVFYARFLERQSKNNAAQTAYGYLTTLMDSQMPTKDHAPIEALFSTNGELSYAYAVLTNRPFPEGETAIAKDPRLSCLYACKVLKKRFIAGEKALYNWNDLGASTYRNDYEKSFYDITYSLKHLPNGHVWATTFNNLISYNVNDHHRGTCTIENLNGRRDDGHNPKKFNDWYANAAFPSGATAGTDAFNYIAKLRDQGITAVVDGQYDSITRLVNNYGTKAQQDRYYNAMIATIDFAAEFKDKGQWEFEVCPLVGESGFSNSIKITERSETSRRVFVTSIEGANQRQEFAKQFNEWYVCEDHPAGKKIYTDKLVNYRLKLIEAKIKAVVEGQFDAADRFIANHGTFEQMKKYFDAVCDFESVKGLPNKEFCDTYIAISKYKPKYELVQTWQVPISQTTQASLYSYRVKVTTTTSNGEGVKFFTMEQINKDVKHAKQFNDWHGEWFTKNYPTIETAVKLAADYRVFIINADIKSVVDGQFDAIDHVMAGGSYEQMKGILARYKEALNGKRYSFDSIEWPPTIPVHKFVSDEFLNAYIRKEREANMPKYEGITLKANPHTIEFRSLPPVGEMDQKMFDLLEGSKAWLKEVNAAWWLNNPDYWKATTIEERKAQFEKGLKSMEEASKVLQPSPEMLEFLKKQPDKVVTESPAVVDDLLNKQLNPVSMGKHTVMDIGLDWRPYGSGSMGVPSKTDIQDAVAAFRKNTEAIAAKYTNPEALACSKSIPIRKLIGPKPEPIWACVDGKKVDINTLPSHPMPDSYPNPMKTMWIMAACGFFMIVFGFIWSIRAAFHFDGWIFGQGVGSIAFGIFAVLHYMCIMQGDQAKFWKLRDERIAKRKKDVDDWIKDQMSKEGLHDKEASAGRIRKELQRLIETGTIFHNRKSNGKISITIPKIDIPKIIQPKQPPA